MDTARKRRGRFALPRPARAGSHLPRCRASPRRISELTRGCGRRASLPAARRDRGAAVALDRAGTAGRDHQGRTGPPALGVIRAADPGRAPGQALAVPIGGSPRATRTSPPGHLSSSTCTRGFTKANGCGPATASCPWTPSRPSRPAAAAAPPPQPGPASPCGSSTNTSATVPSPCWPRSTFTPGQCSPPPRTPPALSPSWTSSARS